MNSGVKRLSFSNTIASPITGGDSTEELLKGKIS